MEKPQTYTSLNTYSRRMIVHGPPRFIFSDTDESQRYQAAIRSWGSERNHWRGGSWRTRPSCFDCCWLETLLACFVSLCWWLWSRVTMQSVVGWSVLGGQ